MNLSLKEKNAVVCGSTQGIGQAIAKELALLGANCTLIARNEEALRKVIPDLDTSLGQHHGFLVADFSKPGEVRTTIEEHVKHHAVHILVNNTGGPPAGMIMDAKEEEFLRAFNQHLICNHILTTTVVPSMKKEGYGRVINIISTTVRIPLKNLGVSNTIRGAVASWAKTMANELGQFNITVNNLLPGNISTQRLASLIDTNAKAGNTDTDRVEQSMKNEIPMKRFGEPSEIAAVAAFLASPAGSYVSGVSIPVDGGKTGSI
jgi:3-oxoacyl-[acyl-carrier protein] reductase